MNVVQSTKYPNSIEMIENEVRVNKNIVTVTKFGIQMYEYEQETYTKDEFIILQQQKIAEMNTSLDELRTTVSNIPSSSGGGSSVVYRNVTLHPEDFVSDDTYSEFPYAASVYLEEAVGDVTGNVIFSPHDSQSGVFAPLVACEDGYVYVFARFVPNDDIVVQSIEIRGISQTIDMTEAESSESEEEEETDPNEVDPEEVEDPEEEEPLQPGGEN